MNMDLEWSLRVVSLLAVVLHEICGAPCSQLTCDPSTTCKEVFDSVTGLTSGQCLTSPEVTGNENVCQQGAPLFVYASNRPLEASCAPDTGPRHVPACPPGYFCFFNPPVCCPAFTKSSTCPETPWDGRIGGVCVTACGSDAQCQLDLKCCNTACGGTGCQAPTSSCAAKTCAAGEKCVMLQGSCTIPPCASIPTCINVRGICPKPTFSWDLYSRWCYKECSLDSQCPPLHKCCFDYFQCGTKCQPSLPSFTCQHLLCSANQKCLMQADTSCPVPPCYNIPACINTATACNPTCGTGFVCGLARNPTSGRQEFRCLPISSPSSFQGGVCDEICQQFILFLALQGGSK